MNNFRMIEWFFVSMALFALIGFVSPQQLPVAAYKILLVTTAAWMSYWIDRTAFPYARPDDLALTSPIERSAAMIRRAIIIGSAMIAVSVGL